MAIHQELTSGAGYCLGYSLTPAELQTVRTLITRQYLDHLRVLAPELVPAAEAAGVDGYHTLTLPFDHSSSWPKETRLLPNVHVADFAKMDFVAKIAEQFGPVIISHDELNWRLVRPLQPTDIGPIHADGWFWDAGYGSMPAGYDDRFKIWIAIHTEPGANGLMVLPDSHTSKQWKHHFEVRDGIRKPVLDEKPEDLPMKLLPLLPGQMVLFHDLLLHGGVVNRGKRCRVSIELTILFNRAEAEKRLPALLERAAHSQVA